MVSLIVKNILIEGKQEAFVDMAKELVLETRKEPGCISYDLVADQEDPSVYFFVEKYQDMDAVAAHRASAHFQKISPQLKDFRVKPSELFVCDVVSFSE